ncbi:MAG: hypothetical protein KF810_02640 [Rhizobiaceae bacterium]|nr:hypothetical protein [Rhizobiaceae bacterium]
MPIVADLRAEQGAIHIVVVEARLEWDTGKLAVPLAVGPCITTVTTNIKPGPDRRRIDHHNLFLNNRVSRVSARQRQEQGAESARYLFHFVTLHTQIPQAR